MISGRVYQDGETLMVGDEPVPTCQGTTAMLLAAHATAEATGGVEVHALLGGDIGRGDGTREVYQRLSSEVERTGARVLEFHYLQPIMALMRSAACDLEKMGEDAPMLVADAGGMYAARAAGVAHHFELMTPDVGEVGFLADESVTHPAYVKHYLFGNGGFDPVALAKKAQEGTGARVLLVKGETDHVIEEGMLRGAVSDPLVPQLEAIGGTGDTLTGIVSALLASGMDTVPAALHASAVNRIAGSLMVATPAMRASDLVDRIPEALATLA